MLDENQQNYMLIVGTSIAFGCYLTAPLLKSKRVSLFLSGIFWLMGGILYDILFVSVEKGPASLFLFFFGFIMTYVGLAMTGSAVSRRIHRLAQITNCEGCYA